MSRSKHQESRSGSKARRGLLAPDPALWEALGGNSGLRQILTDFYSKVYADPDLSPFFEDIRQDHSIDKQFSFLRSIFTGSRDYFGNRPRKAHWWMVISDELFNHRENLLQESLIGHGVDPEMARRVLAVSEIFRRAIVKDEPVTRRIGGRELPSEGYEQMELSVGSLCDGCEDEVKAGETVSFHVRTGKVRCSTCTADGALRVHQEDRQGAEVVSEQTT